MKLICRPADRVLQGAAVNQEPFLAHDGLQGGTNNWPISAPNSLLPRARTLCTNSKNPRYSGKLSVTVWEGATFSVRWGPDRNEWVSAKWLPPGWLGSRTDRPYGRERGSVTRAEG